MAAIRVMTVNLLNGRADPASFAALVDEVRPDVVAAQELGPNAAEVVTERFSFGIVDPGEDHMGRALVATRPFRVTDLELPYRPGLRGFLDVDGIETEILSVHLANPVAPPRGRLPERRRQIEALERWLRRRCPRILMGDLNSTPAWPAYRRLTAHLDDVVARWAQETGVRAPRTWGHRPWWPAVLRIDHVLATGFVAVGVDVRRVRGTDHRAVVVDLIADRTTGVPERG